MLNEELIAPCGINCGLCHAYLADAKGIPKERGKILHCTGCRPREKRCAYLKGHCELLGSGKIRFCFECAGFPCRRLVSLNRRYIRRYSISPIQNLAEIDLIGVAKFLDRERNRHKCPKCGGSVCMHNGKCYDCDAATDWRNR